MPDGQWRQLVDAVPDAYWPASQSLQVLPVALWYWPTAQAVHSTSVATANLPFGHTLHAGALNTVLIEPCAQS